MTKKKWQEFAVGHMTNLHWSVELTHLFIGHLTNFGWSGGIENLALNHLTNFNPFREYTINVPYWIL